jgi:ABC-2 type transport system ATP-binding protein
MLFAMTAPIVQIAGLCKQYGPTVALKPIDWQVETGQVVGLLGPNGAGKTTLIRLLMGFLKPTAGVATIGGFDCTSQSEQVRQLTAYLPAETRLSRSLTGSEVLQLLCQMRPQADLRRAIDIADQLELDLQRMVSRMSTGMRQKTALCVVMAFNTELIILDEPTANLDPTARSTVLRLVHEARSAGRTVIFSSHVLSEVEEVCDHVALLKAGELVHQQPVAELRKQHRIYLTLKEQLPMIPESLRSVITLTQLSDQRVRIDSPGELSMLLGWLATVSAQEIAIEPVRLQAVYEQYHPATELHREFNHV